MVQENIYASRLAAFVCVFEMISERLAYFENSQSRAAMHVRWDSLSLEPLRRTVTRQTKLRRCTRGACVDDPYLWAP